MTPTQLVHLLQSELERSTGCTDPGAVILAVSRAVRELGRPPQAIHITVSPNLFKNGVNVGVPGTGKRGLIIAAALGAALNQPELGLAILDAVDAEALRQAQVLSSLVTVAIQPFPDPLTIVAEVAAGADTSTVTITNDYSHISQVTRNGSVLYSSQTPKTHDVPDPASRYRFADLYALALTLPVKDLEFLIAAAELNLQAAQIALAHPTRLAAALAGWLSSLPVPYGAMHRAQLLTAAASEARMSGLQAPVMALSGSGNHGILALLGVLAVAQELGSSRQELGRALALSTLTTILAKAHLGRMTALCGCTVAAAPGVAAATTYLLGGSLEPAGHAVQTVIASLAGLICDGAKESCAYKIGTAATVAVQAGYLAVAGVQAPDSMGILGGSVDETLIRLGQLNNPGMIETDHLLLELLLKGVGPHDR